MTHHLPTVYNLSSLQLHPDGSRVLPSASQNQKPRYAARVVQDSRGNWFARDAAGSGAVGRYRKVKEVKGYKEEYDEQQNDVHDVEEDELFERQEEGTTGQRHNSRRAKRQKFLQDYDFLTPTPSDGSDPTHALPSSDLLKSIHYFASSYYHERGQLFNATKEYRQRRKQNRLRRLERQKKVEPDHGGYEELDEDSGQEEANRSRRGGRKKGVIGRIIHRKDMYKMLDGSALMAIGMLIQEYVLRTLKVQIPDGWEDMMRDTDSNEETTIEDEGDPDVGVTDANSENNAENYLAQEDESGGDDDDDRSHDKIQQDNGKREERKRRKRKLETRRTSL